jgi:tRNAThr (cytosine32-N3)-methyltransferase
LRADVSEDELALLFTGSKAPASAHTKATPSSECSTDPDGDDTSPPISDPDPGLATPASPIQRQEPQIHPLLSSSLSSDSESSRSDHSAQVSHPLFSIDHLGLDRRLIVNRKRRVTMYRIWVQGSFQKV